MFKAKQYRAKAAESAESLKHTDVPSEIREFQRSKESFTALAQNEDWLANNFDKIIHSQTAGSMGDVLKSAALRAQIARFLHSHKDQESPAGFAPKPDAAKGTPHGT